MNLPPDGFANEGPPDGFADTPEPTFMGNVGKGLKGIYDTGSRIGQGIIDLPQDTYQTGKQLMNGGYLANTPIGQDMSTITGSVAQMPKALLKQGVGLAAEPFKHIPGYIGDEMKKAYPGNPYYDQPVESAMALAPLASPLFGALREIPAVEEGLNAAKTSMRENLVAPNARRALGKFPFGTPTEEANKVGLTAMDQGVIKNPLTHPLSSGREAMLERANAINDSLGENIGAFLKGQGEGLDATKAMKELDAVKEQFLNDPLISRKVDQAKNLIAKNTGQFSEGPQPSNTMEFTKANKLKGLFQKKVNYVSDAATQDSGKAIAGNFRNSIDSQLDELSSRLGNKEGMESFQADKKMFGQTRQMQDVLEKQTNRDSRNMPVSLPSVGVGVGGFIKGGGPQGALAALAAEWTKRYGNSAAASMMNDVSNAIGSFGEDTSIGNASKAAPILSQVKKTLDESVIAKYMAQNDNDPKKAAQAAEADGYKW